MMWFGWQQSCNRDSACKSSRKCKVVTTHLLLPGHDWHSCLSASGTETSLANGIPQTGAPEITHRRACVHAGALNLAGKRRGRLGGDEP